MILSLPWPPQRWSLPLLPLRRSSPRLPWRRSAPPRPLRLSSPSPPARRSALSVPTRVSSPPVPVRTSARASCPAKNAPTITTISVSKMYSRFIRLPPLVYLELVLLVFVSTYQKSLYFLMEVRHFRTAFHSKGTSFSQLCFTSFRAWSPDYPKDQPHERCNSSRKSQVQAASTPWSQAPHRRSLRAPFLRIVSGSVNARGHPPAAPLYVHHTRAADRPGPLCTVVARRSLSRTRHSTWIACPAFAIAGPGVSLASVLLAHS